MEKMRKMMKIEEIRKDIYGKYKGELLMGSVNERIKIIRKCEKNYMSYFNQLKNAI
jgi:hypothetical protein